MDKKEYLQRLSKNILRYRAIAGLNQLQVAEKAGLSRQGFIDIEKGKAEPKTSNLQKIADSLEVSIFDLFKEQPKFVSLRFRTKKNMAARDKNLREQTLIEFRKWLDDYKFLEAQLDNHAEFRLAKLVGIQNTSPKEMARQVRNELKRQEKEPIVDICGLMESAGIKVWIGEPKTQAFSGFSLSEKDGGPAIGVNASIATIEHKIFTAAHELGHILLHPNSYCDQDKLEADDADAEKEAYQFAGYFLMPEIAFDAEWGKNSGFSFVDRVLRVKRYFKVSYKTVLMRLGEKNPASSKNHYSRFCVEFKREKGHDLKDYFEPDSISSGFKGCEPESSLSNLDFMEERYKRLVRLAFEKELITLSKAAEMFGISLSEMRELGVSWRESP